ncbi:metallophosphoesterase [Clostridium carnis]
MKITVLSDSHYDISAVECIKKYLNDVDMVLHCGDGATDLEKITSGFNGEVYAVKGNCDISPKYPLERIIEVEGKRIFICHGHLYNVKNEYNTIFYKGKEVSADIILFGHSHKSIVIESDNTILMNPGSVSLPYGRNKKSIGLLEICYGEKAKAKIIEIV